MTTDTSFIVIPKGQKSYGSIGHPKAGSPSSTQTYGYHHRLLLCLHRLPLQVNRALQVFFLTSESSISRTVSSSAEEKEEEGEYYSAKKSIGSTVMLTFLCRDRRRPVTVPSPFYRTPSVPLASQSVQRPLASLSVL
jgi:hypothetical protein